MTPLQKDKLRKGIILFFVAAVVFSVFTSSGEKLDKALKAEAKAIPDLIKDASARVAASQKKYQSLQTSKAFEPIRVFAKKENWDSHFQKANDILKQAQTLNDKALYPLIKKNKPEVAKAVRQEIDRIKKLVDDARKTARKPASRFSKIQETITRADQFHQTASQTQTEIARIISNLQNGVIAKALQDFPDLTEKINVRFAPAAQLETDSWAHLKTINDQYALHSSGQKTDYAAFTDRIQALADGLNQAQALEVSLKKEMSELYTSYTKILKDMKQDLYVTVKRESWDENSDFYNPEVSTFTRQVSPEAYEILTSDTVDTIGTIAAGFTGSRFSSNVGSAWEELNINPTENWPSRSHNAASFWVEDSTEAYYHQYILEKNGETIETDWEKVDEETYDANLDFLGMAILSKPYGTFEKDAITQATPPGMAYVGNPKYGEWKQDDQGDRFWSWYGKYMFFSHLFFFPPSYYYYNSWAGWNSNYRNRRPYFGTTQNGFQQYGTNGSYVKKSPKFQSTNFAKSGGFRSQTASVRGAGANLRGGGPKGKGK